MIFSRRIHKIQKNKLISILTPKNTDYKFTAANDRKGNEIIISNSSGFEFFRDCLLIAANIQKDEVVYIPVDKQTNEYRDFNDNLKFYKGIYLRNYCSTQISSKELGKLTALKPFEESIITLEPIFEAKYIDHWKIEKRLTVKEHKENFIISTNADGFVNLANGANHFTDWGDDIENNQYYGHRHFDWSENTSKSIGLTFYYWQT